MLNLVKEEFWNARQDNSVLGRFWMGRCYNCNCKEWTHFEWVDITIASVRSQWIFNLVKREFWNASQANLVLGRYYNCIDRVNLEFRKRGIQKGKGSLKIDSQSLENA